MVDGAGYSTSTASFGYSGLLDKSGSTGNGPKAYLNYIIFDREYNFKNGGFVRMTDAAREYGQDGAHEKLAAEFVINEPGYVYIYLSNDNAALGGQNLECYFDDLKVEHIQSLIISQRSFYSFGLTFDEYEREHSFKNRYLYNQGTGEKMFRTERVFDLGLNVDQSKYRTYDYITGRWWQIDPLADEPDFTSLTPYNYSFNNPVLYNDPDGDCPTCLDFIEGAIDGFMGHKKGEPLANQNYVLDTGKQHDENEGESGGESYDAGKRAGEAAFEVVDFFVGPGKVQKLANLSKKTFKKTFKEIVKEVIADKEKAGKKQAQDQLKQKQAEKAKEKAKKSQGSAEHTTNKQEKNRNKHEEAKARKEREKAKSNNPNKKKQQQQGDQ
ncbi:MAG: RHS repeat domain-containing protein [Bacteroidota bacterium]